MNAPVAASAADPKADQTASPEPRKESLRDTLESIVFAFILAFLFRTFEAEAFVIPTGSMAPTLYGRHKEATCSKCGTKIVVGASDEYDADTGMLKPGTRLKTAVCPNCRYNNRQMESELAFNGDRILVNKFPYEIGEPHRWDVFVFKFPEEPDMNYIKRLVGLPGETIRVRQGDLYSWNGTEERILRKPDPNKQRVLQMTVYDDNHPSRELLEADWPERWAGVSSMPEPTGAWDLARQGWKQDAANRSFKLEGAQAGETRWIRYRNFMPSPHDWDLLEAKLPLEPKQTLLFDFCPYNAITGERLEANVDEGAFWTGDLTLNATIEIQEVLDQPAVTFEVCEGIYWYRCRINPQTGQAALIEINQAQDPNLEKPLAEAQTVITGPGTYHVSFANVDNRLCVWINDQLVDFGDKALLQRDGGTTLSLPQLSDLSPVGIAAQGVSATVKNLVLQRDVYYRSGTHAGNMLQVGLESRIGDFEKWREHYAANAASDQQEIKVDDDGFLAFGDNSPRSRDSRLWQTGMQSVPRRNLVGRAFFIYWPHGVPFLNDGRGYSVWDHRVPATDEHGRRIIEKVEDYPKWTVPFYPQFNRMRRIR